ncbi:MAG: hypothetical protein PHH86_10935 [Sphaerochaetaceae bacterium]|nr:hypothetical protein [Sphaerochaetaceae bacterium]
MTTVSRLRALNQIGKVICIDNLDELRYLVLPSITIEINDCQETLIIVDHNIQTIRIIINR